MGTGTKTWFDDNQEEKFNNCGKEIILWIKKCLSINQSFIPVLFLVLLLIFAFTRGFSQNCSGLNLSFNNNLLQNGCTSQDTLIISNTSTGSQSSSAQYFWLINNTIFDTTTGLQSPDSVFLTPGQYTLSMIGVTPGNCRDTISQNISVTLKPSAGFYQPIDTVCTSNSVKFFGNTTDTFPGVTYNWDFGDGTTLSNYYDSASHIYSSPGNYTIKLIVINQPGCSDSFVSTLRVIHGGQPLQFYDVNGTPHNSITWTRCINLITSPDSFSQVFASPDTLINYWVDYGDGTTQQGDTVMPYMSGFLQHTYTKTGIFNLIVRARDRFQCDRTFYGKVINLRVPTVGLGGPKNGIQSGCIPMITSFFNASTNVSPNTTFLWDFGDGTTATFDASNAGDSVYHTYNVSVCNMYVTLTASNQCGNTQSTWGPINAYTIDQANISGTVDLCYPDTATTLQISSTFNCYSGVRYYYWDFGDGTNSGWSTFPLPQTHRFPDTGTYRVVLIDSNICGVDSATTQVNIYYPPTADFSFDTVCYGDSTTFVNLSFAGHPGDYITSYTWNFGDGSTSTEANPKHKFPSYGNYTVTLTVQSSSNCYDVISRTVYVKESPVVSMSSISGPYICDSSKVTFQSSFQINSSSIDTFYWDFGDMTYSSQNNPTHIYSGNGTYSVKLYAHALNGCYAYDSEYIYVYSSPIADFSSDSICFGSYTKFRDKSTTINGENIVSRKWDFNSDGITDKTSKNPKYYFPSYGTYSIRLIVETEYGCKDTVIKTSNVYQNPIVQFSASINSLCTYDSVLFKNTSVAADSFVWNFKDGTSLYKTNSPDSFYHRFDNGGNYYVSLTAINYHGCRSTDSQIVTVKAPPQSQFVTNYSSGCEPLTIQFVNSTSQADAYYWDFGNGTISHSHDTTITYTLNSTADTSFQVILVSEKQGCYDTMTKWITVYHKPVASFDLLPDSGCSPLRVNIHNLSQGADSFYWSCTSGDTSTSTQPEFVFGNYLFQDITYQMTLYASTQHGCSDTASFPIKVKPSPFALFASDKIQGCHPLTVQFTNYSIIADSFLWDFGDGTLSFDKNPEHIFQGVLQDTSYYVQLITLNQNGCSDTFGKNILVYKKVIAYFNNHDTACLPLTIQFQDSSTNADYWKWYFGDGNSSTLKNPLHTYSTAGTYDVNLVVSTSSGCFDTFTMAGAVKANQNPSAAFTVNTLSGCEPLNVKFLNTSIHADTFSWEFGDGQFSCNSSPSHDYYTPNQDTIYTVKLVAKTLEGCTDSTIKNITVYKGAKARFYVSDSGCMPLTVYFRDSSEYVSSWYWDFGNGSSSLLQNPVYTYTSAGNYTVRLIAANNHCSDTFRIDSAVKVFQMPDANFSLLKTSGCEPLKIQFSNLSLYADNYFWDFGDQITDSLSYSPLHTYYAGNGDTVYNCKLRVVTTHGCTDSLSRNITVYKSTEARFHISEKGCSPLKVKFQDSSSNALFYLWDFGNGSQSISKNPEYTYYTPGNYTITLITSNYHCSDTLTLQNAVQVYPVPQSLFATDKTAGCEPLKVSFYNQSSGYDSIYWDFGDGHRAQHDTISHIFTTPVIDTVIQVTLFTFNQQGCSDSLSRNITVYKGVKAYFNTIDSGCVPLHVKFYDSSSFAHFWLWDFGDGNTSTFRNPDYYYYNPGEYNVTLIASNYHCADTFSLHKNIKTFENPIALFSVDKIKGCEPLDVEFTSQSYKADYLKWNFGNSIVNNVSDLTHTFVSQYKDTTFTVQLIASTSHGCSDTFERNIIIFGRVDARFQNYDSGCVPLKTSFQDSSSNALFWFWDFGDGAASVLKNPEHTYYKPGTYTVKLIASNNYCSDTVVLKNSINAWEVPVSNFITNKDTVIFPHTTFDFISLSKPSLSHTWLFGDGSSGSGTKTSHSYPDTGNYYPALIVSTEHCSDTSYRKIRVVPPLPIPDFSFWPNDGCIPLTVHFTDSSKYAGSWIWSFGDGTTSNKKNPIYTYKVPGTYDVTLIVSNNIGTTQIIKKSVIVAYPQPAAWFDVTPQIAYLPNANVKLINRTQGAVSYQWFIDNAFISSESDPVLTYNYPGTHDVTLIAVSDKGCKDTITRLNIIRIDSHGLITVPNAFTPGNKDNLNDVFKPLGYGFDKNNYHFMVFNRWGEMIFETTDPEVGWDGTFRGELCESEIYYWIVTVKLFSEGLKTFDGKVHLVR